MPYDRVSRRRFFYGALLAGAVPAGGFSSAPSLAGLGYKSPNEKLNIASIGAGGRAADDILGCESENIVALADPDSDRAAAMFHKYPKAPKYADFRKMLDKEAANIDAVIIAIPDFMHGTAAMWSIERGKHVYLEKPLTKTVWEARQLVEAAAKYKVATQMGNQGMSNEGAREACEIIWSGEIGNVTEVHCWTDAATRWPQGVKELPPAETVPATLDWDAWLGIAKTRPYSSAYLPFKWRGWYDFGAGPLGDEALHLFGCPNMALRLTNPVSVEVVEKSEMNPYTYPTFSSMKWEFPARGAFPPVTCYWYDRATGAMYRPPNLPEGEPVLPSLRRGGRGGGPPNPPSAAQVAAAQKEGAVFCGDKGYLAAGGEGASVVCLLPEARAKDYELPPRMLTRSPGHYRDWIRACKGGEPAVSNFNVSGPLAEWVLLGNIALRFEGKLEWDAAKMQFANNREANQYLEPPAFHNGWKFA
ncbi:MAG: Gfo/Idh/MocA family oxidoreductase [Bryobacteraceae bacterium]|jgi:predicted dehydrogenase